MVASIAIILFVYCGARVVSLSWCARVLRAEVARFAAVRILEHALSTMHGDFPPSSRHLRVTFFRRTGAVKQSVTQATLIVSSAVVLVLTFVLDLKLHRLALSPCQLSRIQ